MTEPLGKDLIADRTASTVTAIRSAVLSGGGGKTVAGGCRS